MKILSSTFAIVVLLTFSNTTSAHSSTDWDYPNSYLEAQANIRNWVQNAQRAQFSMEHQMHSIPTRTSQTLQVDSIYLTTSEKPKNLLILSSGVHGAEAFTGSALQLYFLKKMGIQSILKKTSILIVHSLNPYGFHFNRRVTENNVDLNRNFLTESQRQDHNIDQYKALNSFLNPTEKVHRSWYSDAKVFMNAVFKVLRLGKKSLRQATVGGQYGLKKGVFFGGKQREPNSELFQSLILKYGTSHENILHIDLHTGYGERGVLHLFSTNHIPNLKHKKRFAKLFSELKIDRGDEKDFYVVSGEITQQTVESLSPRLVIPMTFEFGTQDSQTFLGGFFSLRTMILENQGFHSGYKTPKDEEKTKKDFSELFNPNDPLWRKRVFTQFEETLNLLLRRFEQI